MLKRNTTILMFLGFGCMLVASVGVGYQYVPLLVGQLAYTQTIAAPQAAGTPEVLASVEPLDELMRAAEFLPLETTTVIEAKATESVTPEPVNLEPAKRPVAPPSPLAQQSTPRASTVPQSRGVPRASQPLPTPSKGTSRTRPVSSQFGIIIPKLNVNTAIGSVDPFDIVAYGDALFKYGVAHARGSAYPGEQGNASFFGHSSVVRSQVGKVRPWFVSLNKLVKGDEFSIYYRGTEYTYVVTNSNIVPDTATEYLEVGAGPSSVTLITCWPIGTSQKRLVVTARPK